MIVDLLGCKLDIIHASGKTGFGENNIATIIERIPPPKEILMNLTSFDFDSHYNPFRGIEVIFRVKNGQIKKRQKLNSWPGNEYFADEIGTLKLNQVPKQVISAGDVGYLSGIKEAKVVSRRYIDGCKTSYYQYYY
jgi:GTP-binding protein LepA